MAGLESERLNRNTPPAAEPLEAEPGTVEAWAIEYVTARSLAHKLSPPTPPAAFERTPRARRLSGPGRPAELRPARRRLELADDLTPPSARAKLLHTFFHHELQAAELMLWALLAFADAEPPFRAGLLRICLDEIRHMNAYRAHIQRLGFDVGAFPVRDWFWKRVPSCNSKLSFVALMGMGFEGANLEHAPYFGDRLLAAGDLEACELQQLIAREERNHVRFAVTWFERWTGGQSFEAWCAALPPPMSPMVMRGKAFDRAARSAAGMSAPFLDALERWQA